MMDIADVPLQTVRDRVLLLRSLPTFQPLDDEALLLMAEHSRLRRFRAGETLLKEGEPTRAMYIVLDGRLSSRKDGRLVAMVERARGVGFLALLARDEKGVEAVAEENSLTIEVPGDAILASLESSFSLMRNTLRLLASTLVRKRGNLPASPDDPPALQMGTWREQPRTVIEIMLDTRASPGLFSTCNLDALLSLSRNAFEVRAPAGTEFWQIGEPASHSLRVDYGHVRCTGADGRLVDVGHRFVLGVLDALANEPRSYRAVALTPVIAYVTRLDALLATLENHFDLARELAALLARNSLRTSE